MKKKSENRQIFMSAGFLLCNKSETLIWEISAGSCSVKNAADCREPADREGLVRRRACGRITRLENFVGCEKNIRSII